jgi:hypothetical protein
MQRNNLGELGSKELFVKASRLPRRRFAHVTAFAQLRSVWR